MYIYIYVCVYIHVYIYVCMWGGYVHMYIYILTIAVHVLGHRRAASAQAAWRVVGAQRSVSRAPPVPGCACPQAPNTIINQTSSQSHTQARRSRSQRHLKGSKPCLASDTGVGAVST